MANHLELLTRGVEEVIEKKSLLQKLANGKKLVVKYGADPSRPDLHLGHLVGLRKLRALQEMGHKIVFLIGDYTGMIGDPTDRTSARQPLTLEEVEKNAKSYLSQVGKILDLKKTKTVFNSEWYSKGGWKEVLELTSKFTIARILERDDFEKRVKANKDIGVQEILYPIMQAYDSVVLKSDIEIGGTDQKFNMIAGRKLQKRIGQAPQDIITLPLLVGTDGKKKMSKSLDNYIGITEAPKEIFGKIMSLPDSCLVDYFESLTDESIEELSKEIKVGKNPRDLKIRLAKIIITDLHNQKEATKAEQEFINQFQKKELPSDIKTVKLSGEFNILDLLFSQKLVESKSDARRMVEQGAVKLNGKVEKDLKKIVKIQKELVIQVGKRRFLKINEK